MRSGPELRHKASATARNCSPWHAADLLHQLRRVAAEVALEHLEHAAGVLEGGIGLRRLAAEGRAVGAVLLALGRLALQVAGLGGGRAWPAYCQDVVSYEEVSASQPENRPSRSSVSRKSSDRMAEALVYATT